MSRILKTYTSEDGSLSARWWYGSRIIDGTGILTNRDQRFGMIETTPLKPGKSYIGRCKIKSATYPHPPVVVFLRYVTLDGEIRNIYGNARLAVTKANEWQAHCFAVNPGEEYNGVKIEFFVQDELIVNGQDSLSKVEITGLHIDEVDGQYLASDHKTPFESNSIKIDSAGRFSVLKNNKFEQIQLRGIHNGDRQDFSVYSDMGFNLVPTIRSTRQANLCVDAGMYYFLDLSRLCWGARGRSNILGPSDEYHWDQFDFIDEYPGKMQRDTHAWKNCLGYYVDNEGGITPEYNRIIQVIGWAKGLDNEKPVIMVGGAGKLAPYINVVDAAMLYTHDPERSDGQNMLMSHVRANSALYNPHITIPAAIAINNVHFMSDNYTDNLDWNERNGFHNSSLWRDMGAGVDVTKQSWSKTIKDYFNKEDKHMKIALSANMSFGTPVPERVNARKEFIDNLVKAYTKDGELHLNKVWLYYAWDEIDTFNKILSQLVPVLDYAMDSYGLKSILQIKGRNYGKKQFDLPIPDHVKKLGEFRLDNMQTGAEWDNEYVGYQLDWAALLVNTLGGTFAGEALADVQFNESSIDLPQGVDRDQFGKAFTRLHNEAADILEEIGVTATAICNWYGGSVEAMERLIRGLSNKVQLSCPDAPPGFWLEREGSYYPDPKPRELNKGASLQVFEKLVKEDPAHAKRMNLHLESPQMLPTDYLESLKLIHHRLGAPQVTIRSTLTSRFYKPNLGVPQLAKFLLPQLIEFKKYENNDPDIDVGGETEVERLNRELSEANGNIIKLKIEIKLLEENEGILNDNIAELEDEVERLKTGGDMQAVITLLNEIKTDNAGHNSAITSLLDRFRIALSV